MVKQRPDLLQVYLRYKCVKMIISNGMPFVFRHRRERIDWRKLASVDVDRVARDVDIQTLQENTSNVTFCDVQAELEPNSLDPNFIKLFRLAQLIIEYLMYSQECLSSALSSQEQQLLEKSQRIEDLKAKLEKQKVKFKKVDEKPSYVILNGIGDQHKCSYCPKLFMNELYLHSHIQRRHPDQSAIVSIVDPQINNAVGKELLEIKEQLKMTENRLLAEKNLLENASVKEQIEFSRREVELWQEMEKWKVEQLEDHRKELSTVREQFLNDLKVVNEKFLNSEKQLQELKQKSDTIPSSLRIDDDNRAEVFRHHQQEMIQLKQQFKEQMESVEHVLQQQFNEKDKHWEEKLQQMEQDHSEEMRKLTDALHTKINAVPFSTQMQYPTENEMKLTHQIEALEKQNRRLKQKQLQQGKRLLEFMNNTHHSSTNAVIPTQLQSHAVEKTPSVSSFENMDDVTDHSLAKVESALKHHPNIIQGMREEVANLLEEKLEKIGISRNIGGVKDSTLSSKLASQQCERQNLTKKYKSLLSLREQLQHQVESIAQSKIKASKTVPSTPLRAKKSLKKLFSSMREKVKSVTVRSRSHSPSGRIPLHLLDTRWENNSKSLSDGVHNYHFDGTTKENRVIDTDSDSSVKEDSNLILNAFAEKISKETDDSEDSDSSESEGVVPAILSVKPNELIVTSSSTPRRVIPRSPSVAQLVVSLERQLEGRKSKPLGGIDVIGAERVVKQKSTNDENITGALLKRNSNGLSASLEDVFNTASWNNRAFTGKGETENSSNTGATSVWNSSASKKAALQPSGALSHPTSSLVSVSSWDSENDVSDLA